MSEVFRHQVQAEFPELLHSEVCVAGKRVEKARHPEISGHRSANALLVTGYGRFGKTALETKGLQRTTGVAKGRLGATPALPALPSDGERAICDRDLRSLSRVFLLSALVPVDGLAAANLALLVDIAAFKKESSSWRALA